MLLEFLKKYNKFGCIGRSDTLPREDFMICFAIGQIIGNIDKYVLSGNADGADNAFAQGINAISPASLTLFLPDKNHNFGFIDSENEIIVDKNDEEWAKLAEEFHPHYRKMKPYVKKLFRRNAGIALNSDAIIAFPNKSKSGWGGTGHTIRMAKSLNKEIFLIEDETKSELRKEIVFILKNLEQ